MSADASPQVSVPLELLQALAPAAEALGVSLPGIARFAPTVDVMAPPRALALELGRLASKQNLFLRGVEELVTVDEDSGDLRAMRPARFTTWIAEFVSFYVADRGGKRECGLSRETATLVLESDVFRNCLRKLTAVHLARLPVFRADGKVDLLSPGYDAASRVWTVESIAFDTDWDLPRCRLFFHERLAGYPWSEGGEVDASRSASVQVAAIVGTFCRALFAPGTPRPMIAYLANQPGTGKSTLVSMALLPVFGSAPTNKTPKDDEVMDKELETVAQTMQPFVFFDDIGGGMFSNPLNRFITSTAHSGRVMGGNREMFKVPAVTQVFATGNDIKISPDLMRRALIVSLFLAGDVRGRSFTKVISPSGLAKESSRKEFLSATYGLVRHWSEVEDCHRHPRPLESFEEWSAVVGGVLEACGFPDPLAAPDLPAGGDEEGAELRELFIGMATGAESDCVFDRKELVAEARKLGLAEGLVGSEGDKDLDSNANKKLGRQLQRWRGRELVDKRGRRFRFGHRRQKHGATYPLSFIDAAKPPDPPP